MVSLFQRHNNWRIGKRYKKRQVKEITGSWAKLRNCTSFIITLLVVLSSFLMVLELLIVSSLLSK